MTFPPNSESDEQIRARAELAIVAMGDAAKFLLHAEASHQLAKHVLRPPAPNAESREHAHDLIGAFMIGAKALAEALGVNVGLVASVKPDGAPTETTGVDAWCVDLFDLAQRVALAGGAIQTAHRESMERQVLRLDNACIRARKLGEKNAGPLFDRSRVGSDEDAREEP